MELKERIAARRLEREAEEAIRKEEEREALNAARISRRSRTGKKSEWILISDVILSILLFGLGIIGAFAFEAWYPSLLSLLGVWWLGVRLRGDREELLAEAQDTLSFQSENQS